MDTVSKKLSLMLWSLNLVLLFSQVFGSESRDIDPNGYVVYCPCMGRFGNQGDHFLGALSFAHGLDRTLILPPWNEYHVQRHGQAVQIPFDKYFKVDPLREYHRVITMGTFMEELAPSLWPEGKRTGLCYYFRDGKDCKMKEGNPFGPFWDNYDIDFNKFAEYSPLSYNTHTPGVRGMWEKKFPVSEYPVIALSGAPAGFPVTRENRELHRYLHWSEKIEQQADKFIEDNLSEGPFVGVHMRQGSDWINACRHVNSTKQLFASPQCLGYQNEFGDLTDDLCNPSFDLVKEQIRAVVKKIKAKGVFIASDVEPDIKALKKFLPSKVKVVQHKPSNPHVDLAILAKSDHYICNCISSFSAFAKRERDAAGKPSSFWGFGEDYEKIKKKQSKKSPDEL
ncbi:GDP-fucose protein O-fucosyltransferase 1 [Strongylocentrotus purpuratus]|uniref:GDP-fucose protein O-fucosyltransferase 1 n=1 Tax=Strongylocentrotus purpuratus TaxID=7668 RepID=A0A7M7RHL9_STRPU|nr:GDP-fucose protein O-fucosyltransferase 1 [Strongylocentrotus purpuratus]XP_790311.1 GDP-fucose protein O-fucosyltransferase 1 [Strongylocentrotus purpuratus]|eukprot:XP_790311.1 PREDICTED: GDP-fucose protein O-fucosyltransferase 1 isoform X1 [Strongylocentrotus purpuratus]